MVGSLFLRNSKKYSMKTARLGDAARDPIDRPLRAGSGGGEAPASSPALEPREMTYGAVACSVALCGPGRQRCNGTFLHRSSVLHGKNEQGSSSCDQCQDKRNPFELKLLYCTNNTTRPKGWMELNPACKSFTFIVVVVVLFFALFSRVLCCRPHRRLPLSAIQFHSVLR